MDATQLATPAALLRDVGFLLYGGPIVAFAMIMMFVPRLAPLTPWAAVRTYRAWGPGLGLSLGATVLGALLHRWFTTGGFTWGWATAAEQLDLAGWLCFLVMWASNVKLEVWTLEPLRKLDQDGVITDESAFAAGTRGLSRHLALQAVLALAVLILWRLAAMTITTG
jgi:hypothetical protein